MKHALEWAGLVVLFASVAGTIIFFLGLGLLELEHRWKMWRRARRHRGGDIDLVGARRS